jgi:hypothetical protein
VTDEHALGASIGLIDVNGDLETLIRVSDPAYEAPALPHRTDLEPVPGLRLLGYDVDEHRGHWQAWVALRLWWQAPELLREPLKISARLVNAQGQVMAAADAEPVAGTYPTSAWRPGEVVTDAYEIPLPAGLPPGEYVPLVIVYDPATGIERGRAELPPAFLEGNLVRPPRSALEDSLGRVIHARFGAAELLGYTPPNPDIAYRAGDALPLTLLWQAREQPAGEWRLSFWLESEEPHALSEEPVGGRYPTDRWRDGQAVRQMPILKVPSGAVGTYRLKMRVFHNGQPVPWGRSLLPWGNDLDLGLVRVSQ